ncbi:NAD(P)/FAD-dependent oxidoreductase [[Mycobacterium] burgundiense]|uniref:FAD-dependent oxidoreductase n=1 Tax=[Mycobacterium] burgundiense TaxID=3064286 RepID=A0ABM9LQV8_9MYCO|nr:FAD-dependent oxidoreductase [Mycolicibacterium sp. MU0053]CAJ1503200.1 FAD-dependent oxidoreductase [Mycolicibacterium sp. MU0053]
MSRSTRFVIVGAGLAGAKAAETLRDNDFDGHIVLIGDEERLPYERPPLSKEFLAGKKSLPEFTVQPASWYRDHDVELMLGTEVTAIEPAKRAVTLPDGEALGYDKLLLATGSRARRPKLTGADAAGVHYLRTIEESEALDGLLRDGAALAVIGAGWIGLEVTASARERGVAVTVVDTAKTPLSAALGPEAGEIFAKLHREHGVNLLLDQTVDEITVADGVATGLRLGDGSQVEADAVLVAVGAAPNIEIAEAAGLALADGGVAVDASLRTSDPHIYAVGDIAAADNPVLGTRIRTEHWANALKQPAVAARNMLAKDDPPAVYDELPYFFTDQYDLGMEYVGHADAAARVIFRGDVAGREFTAFWLDAQNRVLAGMNVNIWAGLDDIKELVRSRRPVDPAELT